MEYPNLPPPQVRACRTPVSTDRIFLFTHFFVSEHAARQNEIRLCLAKNCANPYLHKIVLLNERAFSPDELGVTDDRIVQVIVGRRWYWKDVCEAVTRVCARGFLVIANADIFLDASIQNVRHIPAMDTRRIAFALLRLEFTDPGPCHPVSSTWESQDTWILHSNHMGAVNDIYNIPFGIPGCDNRLAHELHTRGFAVWNVPYFIQTFHVHASNVRTYTTQQRIPWPYMLLQPSFTVEWGDE